MCLAGRKVRTLRAEEAGSRQDAVRGSGFRASGFGLRVGELVLGASEFRALKVPDYQQLS